MRRAFTLIEIIVVVAILAIMATAAVVGVRSGQDAARVKGATRDIMAAIRHARSMALVMMQPAIITYSTERDGDDVCAKITVDGAKLMSSGSSDTVQTLSGEEPRKADSIPTRELHMAVLRHPGIWVIALSSAFVYITQYGISSWGIFFLQKAKGYALTDAAGIVAVSEGIGVVGTVVAGWLSDRVFRGNRLRPVILCGVVCLVTLALFLLTGGGFIVNVVFLSVASLTLAALYCIVSGLMALDIVPRKATGAALGVVGISSYAAAALQSTVSGVLIETSSTGGQAYDFTPVAWFWIVSCLVSFLLPALCWPMLRRKVADF